ncbi:MAG: RimK family alpha-L-glutamate ligase [Saprospiraceae bacterium]|nr:RimK family alpha-L-glutamate ligase [Saprospiraceae bacterium]
MNIAILSRGPYLYSTRSLLRAGVARGHYLQIIDHSNCSLVVDRDLPAVYCNGINLSYIDAIIPRIGASVTYPGAAVIGQFEAMGIFTSTRADALLQARDKLRSLQRLTSFGIASPKTLFIGQEQNLADVIDQVGGFPVVIKLLESTHGVGVLLAHNMLQASSIVEAFQKTGQRVIVQEFISEAEGADIRVLVVNGEVIAAMKRQAKDGEFRSNLHRGASATPVLLTEQEEEVSRKVARVMGLDVAGIDLLRSYRGPLVMEVNASPGLEGIETTTGKDVAGGIIHLVESKIAELQLQRV